MINYMIMSLKQKKIKFEPRIKLKHNTYTMSVECLVYMATKVKPVVFFKSLLARRFSLLVRRNLVNVF